MNLPGIEDDKTIMLAILIQNALHPKNTMRVEAIKNETYVEIRTLEDAEKFLSDLLENNLDKELQSLESEVKNRFKSQSI